MRARNGAAYFNRAMTPTADLPDNSTTPKAMLLAAQGEIAQLKADAEARMERLNLAPKAARACGLRPARRDARS